MREGTNERTYTTTKHITTLLLCSGVKRPICKDKLHKFFNKTYQNAVWLCRLPFFIPNEFECIQTVWLFIRMSDWPFLSNIIDTLKNIFHQVTFLRLGTNESLRKLSWMAVLKIFAAFFHQHASNSSTLVLIVVSSGPRFHHPSLYDLKKHYPLFKLD